METRMRLVPGCSEKGSGEKRSRNRDHGRRDDVIREEATEQILEAKKKKGLTYAAIAEKLGTHKVWTTAALLGQHPMSAEQADTVVDMLDLDSEVVLALQEIPLRGSLDQYVPTDPTIYRIHEITQVYGTTIKALIHEEFGDGIMSAITFQMDVEREETDQGPRVKITYTGKFLPYSWG
jgi:cyanate lyase